MRTTCCINYIHPAHHTPFGQVWYFTGIPEGPLCPRADPTVGGSLDEVVPLGEGPVDTDAATLTHLTPWEV